MPQTDHYQTLGVPRTATQEEIKRRYRELARQYHPDVNRNKPEAAKMFGSVTSAYKVLSDTDSRAVYDADIALRERQVSNANARPTRPSSPTPNGGQARSATRPPANPADVARLLSEATAAYQRGNFVSARALAEQVLRLQRNNAQAYEILGDVYRLQGKTEEAINMFTRSLQLNPRNPNLMARLERLAQTNPRQATAERAFFSNHETPGTAPPRPVPRPRYDNRPIGSLLTGVLGYGGVFLIVMFIALFPGEANPVSLRNSLPGVFSQWNDRVILALLLSGLLLGATLTMTMAVQRVGEVLWLRPTRGTGGQVPMGLLLVGVSFVSFYAAAVLYIFVGLVRESLTTSILRVFAGVVVITIMLAAVYEPGHLSVAAFGGNLVFLGVLIGWFLGDFFRPDGVRPY